MTLYSTKAMDKYRLHGKGGVNRTVYVGNKTLAQKPGDNTDDAGRIVVVGLDSCYPGTERTAIRKICGLRAREGVVVPQCAVNFGK